MKARDNIDLRYRLWNKWNQVYVVVHGDDWHGRQRPALIRRPMVPGSRTFIARQPAGLNRATRLRILKWSFRIRRRPLVENQRGTWANRVELMNYTLYDGGNLAAKFLLEIGAVEFRPDRPFQFTSGRWSPVYVDIRRLCGSAHARNFIIQMSVSKIYTEIGAKAFQVIAGGETAGIPFAAWIADRMNRPMVYVRKNRKEFGRGMQIEGLSEDKLTEGQHFLLVEDLMSEGGSKQHFIDSIRRTGNIVNYCFVIFTYGCFGAEERLLVDENVKLVSLVDSQLLLRVAEDLRLIDDRTLEGVRGFIADPDLYDAQLQGDPQ